MIIGINGRTFSVENPAGAVNAGIQITRELLNSRNETIIFGHRPHDQTIGSNGRFDSDLLFDSQLYGWAWEQTILPARIREYELDVFYAPNGNPPIIHGSTPTVTWVHSTQWFRGYTPTGYSLVQHALMPRVYRHTDQIITVSEFAASELISELDVPTEKVSVVYNGVDDIFHSEDAGDRLDLPDEYILSVGTFESRKNVATTVRAHRELRERRGSDLDLVLIGPQPKAINGDPDVDIDLLKSDPSVHMLGYVSTRELKYAYTNATVFSFPSKYETFGLAPVEAMASGAPVVASDRGALPEVLGDGAYIVSPDVDEDWVEALETVIEDDELRETLSANGRQRAQRYTWQRAASETLDVLREVAHSGRR